MSRALLFLSFAALAFTGPALMPRSVESAIGNCGQPAAAGPVAADALEVLRTAVGTSDCASHDVCICDVDGSGSVTAADALAVLRKAVGQSVTLACACGTTTTVVTTTTLVTTTSTMPPALGTKELQLLVRSAPTYSASDLPGTWDLSTIAADPVAPSWQRGEIVIDANGNFSATLHGSNGSSVPASGHLTISGTGAVLCSNGCEADFAGALDAGKTVLTATSTNSHGTPQLLVMTRNGGDYAQVDLTGAWRLDSLTADVGSGHWNMGTLTIDANGAVTSDSIDSDGTVHTISQTYAIDSGGTITCSGNCRPDFRGTLDSGKTVMVATSTTADGAAKLNVVTKQAPPYSQPDLTGDWASGTLCAGDAPMWMRGVLSVAADGTLSGTLTGNDGAPTPLSGTLSISANGSITSSTDTRLRCSLDADRTVVACTDSR